MTTDAFAVKVFHTYDDIYKRHDGETRKRAFKDDCARALALLADEAERIVWDYKERRETEGE